jgi:tellurite resistance protein TehA-like permease
VVAAGLSGVLPVSLGIAGVVGMFLWAFATWWLLVALFSVCNVLRQGIPFNLGWWGAVFPLGVYTGGGGWRMQCGCLEAVMFTVPLAGCL